MFLFSNLECGQDEIAFEESTYENNLKKQSTEKHNFTQFVDSELKVYAKREWTKNKYRKWGVIWHALSDFPTLKAKFNLILWLWCVSFMRIILVSQKNILQNQYSTSYCKKFNLFHIFKKFQPGYHRRVSDEKLIVFTSFIQQLWIQHTSKWAALLISAVKAKYSQ